jgi:hypothetical protein
MPANKSWHDYNESLIERGRVLIDLDFIRSSNNEEIKNMNKDKVWEHHSSILITTYTVFSIPKDWFQDSIPYCAGNSTWIIRVCKKN